MPFRITTVAILALVLVTSAQADARKEVTRKTCDMASRAEVIIDRPIREVWSKALDIDAWLRDNFKTVKGKAGEEGEVRQATSEGAMSSYLVTTLRIKPLEQLVLKVSPEKGSDFIGFAVFSFADLGGQTRFIHDFYFEAAEPEVRKEEARPSCKEQDENTQRGVEKNAQDLKTFVERK